MVWKTNCTRQPKGQLPSSSYNHNTLTTLRTSVKESLFKVAARNCHALVPLTDVLRDSQCVVIERELGSCLSGCLQCLSVNLS